MYIFLFFFISQNRSTNKVRYDFRRPRPKFQNNNCVSIVLKAKTKKNTEKNSLTPIKGIFEFEIKTEKNVFIFFYCFSFKNNKRTNIILIIFFENAQKTVINCQKRPKWRFSAFVF